MREVRSATERVEHVLSITSPARMPARHEREQREEAESDAHAQDSRREHGIGGGRFQVTVALVSQ